MGFKCCRSDHAVDPQAHLLNSNDSVKKSQSKRKEKQETSRSGRSLAKGSSRGASDDVVDDEDIKAVQWLRDRSLERSMERSLKSKPSGSSYDGTGEHLSPPASFEQTQEIETRDSYDRTPIIGNKDGKVLVLDDAAYSAHRAQQEELALVQEPKEQFRILSQKEVEQEERREEEEFRKQRRKSERRRKPEEQQPEVDQETERKQEPEQREPHAASSRGRELKKKSSSKKKKPMAAATQAAPPSAREFDDAWEAFPPPASSSPARKKTKESAFTMPMMEVPQSPGDVLPADSADSVARERYLVAVELLHRRIIERKQSLKPAEKEFLRGLLQEESDESHVESKVSAIEATIERLEQPGVPLQSTKPHRGPQTPEGNSLQHQKPVLPQPQSSRSSRSPSSPSDDRKSDISTYSATSSNSGMGMEAVLGHRSTNARKKHASKRALRDTPPSLWDEPDDEDIKNSAFPVLGIDASITNRLLKVRLMEALRGFLPFSISEQNYWLKFSLQRDGASLRTLLHKMRASKYSLIVIQAKDDRSVFGAFTGTTWKRSNNGWYGTGESFLFKQTDTLEVYPFTGSDDMVQYCSSQMLAVGGGDWQLASPFGKNETKGIGLLVDGDLRGGETHSSATFCNPKLARKNEFAIFNLEVWTLTPCMALHEAEKLEARKLFVEQNRRDI